MQRNRSSGCILSLTQIAPLEHKEEDWTWSEEDDEVGNEITPSKMAHVLQLNSVQL